MRFGVFGSIAQLESLSEGYVLLQAGLIQKSGNWWELEIQPTPLLRSMFRGMPPLEELYPVLVEFVMLYRYPHHPGFVDDRKVAQRLVRLGITADGLVMLNERVEPAARWR